MIKEYIATFGLGTKLGKHFVRVKAHNGEAARELMFQSYGNNWAFLYETLDDAGVERWKITEVPFGTPNAKL